VPAALSASPVTNTERLNQEAQMAGWSGGIQSVGTYAGAERRCPAIGASRPGAPP